MNVLLSIKPKYAEAIIAGKKLFEFRRSIFKQNGIDRVYLYATNPVSKVVGSFKVGKIISEEPKLLWEGFSQYSGVSYAEFFKYFQDSNIGYAIEINDLEVFKKPLNPRLFIADFNPPRSFIYIDGQFSNIKNANQGN